MNRKKNLFLALATILSLLGCKPSAKVLPEPTPVVKQAELQPESIPIKHVDDLVVNTSRSYRTAMYGNEKDGIDDIRKLVLRSPLEEAWCYLPN